MSESRAVLPPLLEQATIDEWCFALETKSGQQFVFGHVVVIDAEWIQLQHSESNAGSDLAFDGPVREDAYVIKERGVDIRLDAIAWIASGIS